jgi:hypothetical protein
MIRVKLDVTKIDKSALHKGAKGTYCDITLMDNRDGRDKFDNDGFVVQDLGKDRRLAGERGPILGNWKDLDGGNTGGQRNPQGGRDIPASEARMRSTPPAPPAAQADEEDSDIPF